MDEPKVKGVLTVVPTPIGNLADVSSRVLDALSQADYIAAEDTRVTSQLLSELSLPFKELISYHAHNEQERVDLLLSYLAEGKNIALVSDAGMPGISDPGEIIIKQVIDAGYPITVLPGPSAAITALVASGLSTRYYHFEGFIPAKGKERKERLAYLAECPETMVIYEAPHRLEKTLKDFLSEEYNLGARKICIARELTKRYETYRYLTVSETPVFLKEEPPRGEYVLVLEGLDEFYKRVPEAVEAAKEKLLAKVKADVHQLVREGLRPRSILQILQKHYDLPKNDLYNIIHTVIL